MTDFSGLKLAQPILRAIAHEGYATPTPIQAKAIPHLREGRDLLGIAQTGTGKTAAFTLPLLHALHQDANRPARRHARALVLAPTRELAAQIADSVRTYGRFLRLRTTIVVGGVSARPQIKALNAGVDVLIATPGRLMDLLRDGHIKLSTTHNLVLDEADRMLDMGFIRDVRKIIAHLPQRRQTALFSATMSADIAKLVADILDHPKRVEIAGKSIAVERIDQFVHHLAASGKQALLSELLGAEDMSKVIVFTRTKRGADRVARRLDRDGIKADALHGNKSQNARRRALDGFRKGRARVLVATDIAARGLDVDNVSHVINYELPNEPESYVHRIGRSRMSATMSADIAKLVADILDHPKRVEIAGKSIAVERIDQFVHHLAASGKQALLSELLGAEDMSKVIVFTRTKRGADRVARRLDRDGIKADALHGNKSQNARRRALDGFRKGRARVLVATDIAARGLDVDNVSHVINYELPNEPESYVHRIGRTARGSADGTAISFCDHSERGQLRSIERLIKRPLTVVGEAPEELPRASKTKRSGARRPGAARNTRRRRSNTSFSPSSGSMNP